MHRRKCTRKHKGLEVYSDTRAHIMRTDDGILILVHPVHRSLHDSDAQGTTSMPCSYGYAMTMRRAQGATLDAVALFFDRKRPDRGYSYVGASRVRTMEDLVHVGNVRRTDWLPVGGDPRGFEQVELGIDSESDCEDEMEDDMTDSDESSKEITDDMFADTDPEDEMDDQIFGNDESGRLLPASDSGDLAAPNDAMGVFN